MRSEELGSLKFGIINYVAPRKQDSILCLGLGGGLYDSFWSPLPQALHPRFVPYHALKMTLKVSFYILILSLTYP